MKSTILRKTIAAAASIILTQQGLDAAPTVSRLTPPSALFTFSDPNPPIIARFLPGQRFDLQATVRPDGGLTIVSATFSVDGTPVSGPVNSATADASGVPAGTTIFTRRAYSNSSPGIHNFSVTATLSDSSTVTATGNFEIVGIQQQGRRAKNVIMLIGDGLGIAHRTAARLMLHGAQQGKANALLEMDQMPNTGLVMTHSLNSIVTDSSPGAACFSTGNKGNNNQHGVFPDDTTAIFDNPRVELIGEYLARTGNKSLGIVTTSDVFDATPASFGSHTQSRSAGTGICDQYLDEMVTKANLRVLLGGGRKWFLPAATPGSARTSSTDYVLPTELATGWSVPAGVIDTGRDLLSDFQAAGFLYAPDKTSLNTIPANTDRLLGLFSYSNMNVAQDKIAGRRGNPAIVNDYGFPDQPMLDEMAAKALQVLNRNPNGFVIMIEGASIDKQAHNMDTERWIQDTIEFDRAVGVCRQFAASNPDTLIIVTADHECAGVNIIGASRVTNSDLQTRAASGGGTAQLRTGVVGTYESAGFPSYPISADGYPTTTDPDFKMLIGYAANADRYEDWLTNPQPLRDSQQPFNSSAPLNTYPSGPLNRDVAGNFLVTGQISDAVAAHTASDIPVSAQGRGAALFSGVMDNTEVFFKAMQSVLGGAR
jgi:alkaline phosphatase